MNIDDLTLGQIKQLQSMMGGVPATKPPLVVEQKRVVLVVDRGWIFAGDQSATSDGYIRLDNCVQVFRWEGIGYTRMLTEWRSDKVDIRPCVPQEVPPDAVIFRCPVEPEWGLK